MFNDLNHGFEKEPNEQEVKRYVEIDCFSDEKPIADETTEPVL